MKISTFGFGFGAEYFLLFGLRLWPNVKMQLWSFTGKKPNAICAVRFKGGLISEDVFFIFVKSSKNAQNHSQSTF